MAKSVATARDSRPRRRLGPAQRLSEGEILALLKACPDDASGVRLAALIAVGWRSGVRIQEALDLIPGDLDHIRGTVHVRHGKGDRERKVGLAPDATIYVQRWLAIRASLGVPATAPLFCRIRRPHTGGPLLSDQIRVALPKLAKKAGVTTRTHYHGLRCTLATELAESNQPLLAISSQLGHANIATTSGYLRKIGSAGLAEMMKQHVEQQAAPKAAPGMSEADVQRIAQAVAALGTKLSS